MDKTTSLLSSYARSLTFDDLGPEVVHQVKRTLIDTLGCAMGGFSSPTAQIARDMALRVSSTTPSRILGTGGYSSPDMAAFANGVMLRYLDCNDSYFSPGGGHPSDMIPAALALVGLMGCDGPTFITSIVLAYEVFCRLSDQVVAGDLGWDQGIFSVIGSACAAGKVMGLDQERMGHAISLAVVPNLPLGVTRTGELSMWKGCATASATKAGVFAAQLAGQGMTGPLEPFEGRRGLWAQAVGDSVQLDGLAGRGEAFRISETTFKSYPSQIHTQGPIALALELRPQVATADIESILIHIYQAAASTAATEPEKWAPKTRETADHSIPYLVAVALQDGAVTSDSFADQRIQDPALSTLIAKMAIQEDAGFTLRYPKEFNCRIEVSSRSGANYSAGTAYPKGHRSNPMSDSEVEAKFQSLSSATLTSSQCGRALEIAWSLDSSPDLNELFDCLVV
jgi:2-methylcitrate dehydratase